MWDVICALVSLALLCAVCITVIIVRYKSCRPVKKRTVLTQNEISAMFAAYSMLFIAYQDMKNYDGYQNLKKVTLDHHRKQIENMQSVFVKLGINSTFGPID